MSETISMVWCLGGEKRHFDKVFEHKNSVLDWILGVETLFWQGGWVRKLCLFSEVVFGRNVELSCLGVKYLSKDALL